MNREAYIEVIQRYTILHGRMLKYIPIEYDYENMSDEALQDLAYAFYKRIKLEITDRMVIRYNQYESNRDNHIPNKTMEKAYYRFCKASGMVCEVSPLNVSIKRLIRIYEVYFDNWRI